jgi:secretory phospholipase A2
MGVHRRGIAARAVAVAVVWCVAAGLVAAAAYGSDACAHETACRAAGTVAMQRRFWGGGDKVPPVAPYPFTSNGCGSGGFQVAVSPELVTCCDLHDACYAVCNVSRTYCDNQFQTCLLGRCEKGPDAKRGECAQSARMLSTGAATFGCGAFQSSQKEACECGTAEAATSRFVEAWEYLFRHVVGPRKPASSVAPTVAKMAAHEDPARRAYGALTKYPAELIRREVAKKDGGGDDGGLGKLFGLGDL